MILLETKFKFACNQNILPRRKILLVDNTFNNNAELTDCFALFEWLQTQPKYQKISYYIINKNNVQFSEIAAMYPQQIIPVEHGKLNKQLIHHLITTKYWLDSFQVISTFDPEAEIRRGKITTVYMQHGINYFKTGFIGDLSISPKYFDKIVFSNKAEQHLYEKYYDYSPQNVIMAGLSRWDLIQQKPKEKIIFAYFTSRAYLSENIEIMLTQTHYYKNIVKLLNSPQLINFLTKHNIKLYAGMHHQMMINAHIKEQLSHIHFVEDKDIGSIKQKASMLITDFSSMCFDFMIKDKPVIFFRVDAGDKLCSTHSDSAENDINVESKNADLYNIFYSAKDVISAIEKYVNNNFELEPKYQKKNTIFFTYRSDIRQHLIENLLASPLKVKNKLPKENKPEITVCQTKLFGFLPLCSYKQIGGHKQWKIFGLPIFKIRKRANGITSKYYILGLPILKISKK